MAERRDLLKLIAATPVLASFAPMVSAFDAQSVVMRAIPSSGEKIPAMGMGSYQTFNISDDSTDKQNLISVLEAFFRSKGRLIDSSPMYGRSESVIGALVEQIEPKPKYFSASKVWTYGKQEGLEAVKESERRMRVDKMDLMQVHNLRDWEVHLPTLQKLKSENKLRYTGITTSRVSQYSDFEDVMKSQRLDFIQLNYNIKVREAEKRLLPLAMDRGQAVIVNMPFEKGRLFKLLKGRALPEWSKEFDCSSWAQFFLKFILSHPAVTCTIPATSKVNHMLDNMQAMTGRLPDHKMRNKMIQYFDSL